MMAWFGVALARELWAAPAPEPWVAAPPDGYVPSGRRTPSVA